MSIKDRLKKAVFEAIKRAGTEAELSRELNVSRQAVNKWDKIPVRHLRKIALRLGMPYDKQRPDLF